jgi:hypothetical protein
MEKTQEEILQELRRRAKDPVTSIKAHNERMKAMFEKYETESNYAEKYMELQYGMTIVAQCAKKFVLENYMKVDDWSDINLTVLDNSGEKTKYYKYKEMAKQPRPSVINKLIDEINEKKKAGHNPVNTITEVVLDEFDGDFSIKVNGRDHFWIDDQTIIQLADYIENKLKNDDSEETGIEIPENK